MLVSGFAGSKEREKEKRMRCHRCEIQGDHCEVCTRDKNLLRLIEGREAGVSYRVTNDHCEFSPRVMG